MKPLLIAICGNPTAGKSEAQKILQREYGIVPFDDGRVLRDIAKQLFELTEEQVTTQAGKLEYVEIGGREWQVRDILGSLGNIIEEKFGQQAIPSVSIRRAFEHWSDNKETTFHCGYSFGSVRKTQGKSYRQHDGIVVEIVREGVGPSKYDFDQYDPSYVSLTIRNPAPIVTNGNVDWLAEFTKVIRAALDPLIR